VVYKWLGLFQSLILASQTLSKNPKNIVNAQSVKKLSW
jgi:hypothetical protein